MGIRQFHGLVDYPKRWQCAMWEIGRIQTAGGFCELAKPRVFALPADDACLEP